MPAWSDIYKIWTQSIGTLDPIARKEASKGIEGVGVTVPDAIQDIRQSGEYFGGNRGLIRLRDSNDFIDLSSVTNRQSRYKEYERLRVIPEIENAITIFTDEACVAGHTNVSTPFGMVEIQQLAQEKKPGERFLVYCYDFEKHDYTLGWAHSPRLVKVAKTIVVTFDDGSQIECTEDHRILLRSGEWVEAGKLKEQDEVMPFYRIRPQSIKEKSKPKTRQFPRIFTFNRGWVQERDFIDEWKTGVQKPIKEKLYRITRALSEGLNTVQTAELLNNRWSTIDERIRNAGFTYKELKSLGQKSDRRKVVAVWEGKEQAVYDLSVDKHENFCTDSIVVHNCQMGENNHMFEIVCKNQDIRKELEFLFWHPGMLNLDDQLWSWVRDLFLNGDHFIELILDPDQPKLGIVGTQILPAESMYRIETIKGKLVEFQQSKDGPDYQSLSRVEVTKASEAELNQATALRFAPESIVHFRIGGNRKTFYPYGVSLIEAARGPAHTLKLVEDSMLIYRMSRAPERRIFYIDVGQLQPFKAEALMGRMQDQFRKKKTFSNKGGSGGAGPVNETWVPPAMDEDIWIPLRPNSNTRVETLPGASNLGEIDDCLYFRNKLFISMCFPKNYLAQEDPSITKVTLSSVDVKFARLIERLQRNISAGILQIAIRHLQLQGWASVLYDDLQIKMTPPSHYREISENEVKDARINRVSTLKGTMMFSDYDLMIDELKLPEEKAKERVARAMIQKLQELKLQLMSQNPELLGIAKMGDSQTELGTDANGPNPMLSGEEGQGQEQGQDQMPQGGGDEGNGPMDTFGKPPKVSANQLPEPDEQDLKNYDMEILDYSRGIDEEEIDELEVD